MEREKKTKPKCYHLVLRMRPRVGARGVEVRVQAERRAQQ